MLKGLARYVIIGHSERRAYFCETDESVHKKVHAAFTHGLHPIVCVGENEQQHEAGQTSAVVAAQVRAALRGLSAAEAHKMVLAYEPVWAIGSGKAASPAGANAVIGLTIRGVLTDLFGEAVAQSVPAPIDESAPPPDETLTMRPRPLARSIGSSASVIRQAPNRFVSIASWTTPRSALSARCHVS